MYLPEQNKLPRSKRSINTFKGINRRPVCKEGEFADTLGLCTRDYPALSTAVKGYELDRLEVGEGAEPIFFLDSGIGCIAGLRTESPDIKTLIYKGEQITDFVLNSNANSLNVLQFNDKTIFAKGRNAYEFDRSFTTAAAALKDMGYTLNISATHTAPEYPEPTVKLSLLYDDMTEIGNYSTGTEEAEFPQDAEQNDLFDRYTQPYRLIHKGSSEEDGDQWQPIISFRLRLEVGSGYKRFNAGDYVKLSSLSYWKWIVKRFSALDRFVRIDSVDSEGRYITEPLNVFLDYGDILSVRTYPTNDIEGYNNPVIDNPGNCLYLLGGSISACMPELDFLCSGANRVWGCSNANHEIYASELGNCRNWSVFEGLSGDSYAVTVGSKGDFTSCCSYLGRPIFFKENEMIVISGSKPASFTLNSYSVRGVRRDSPEGVAVVGDVLYYMSYDGVYAYDGSSAVSVSLPLGDQIKELYNVRFGCDGNILYVWGRLDDGYRCYSYDTLTGIWHQIYADLICSFLPYPDTTLKVSLEEGEAIISTLSEIPEDYELVGATGLQELWRWETADISYSTPDHKYIRRIELSDECSAESDLYISYDGAEPVHIAHLMPRLRNSRKIYFFPKRCDRFRIIMEGEGKMTLYSLTIDAEEACEDG